MKCYNMMTYWVCNECVKILGYACMDCKWKTAVRIKIEVLLPTILHVIEMGVE